MNAPDLEEEEQQDGGDDFIQDTDDAEQAPEGTQRGTASIANRSVSNPVIINR